jgi:uncharacterized protein
MRQIRFEWDSIAESKAMEHGITFDEAVTVFDDPDLLFTQDFQQSQGEEREWAIGATENGSILVVVFTIPDKQIRIISARIATSREYQSYESGI